MDPLFSDTQNNVKVSSFAFELVVIDILKDYLKTKNKIIYDSSTFDTKGFDAYLPDGLDDNIPTYVEIKYFNDRKASYFQSIATSDAFRKFSDKAQILLIVGSELQDASKTNLEALIKSVTSATAIVWDISELKKKTRGIFEKYSDLFETPQRVIVSSAINTSETVEQKGLHRNKLIQQLKGKYLDGEVVLVLGAGVSHSAGIPAWDALVSNLLSEMIQQLLLNKKTIRAIDDGSVVRIATENVKLSPILQMRYIRSALDPKDYNLMVRKAIYASEPLPKSALIDSICRLCKLNRLRKGVESIIIYNFDDLLERALRRHRVDFTPITKESDERSSQYLNIYHVHGFLPHADKEMASSAKLVFSEEDYHYVYRDAYCWSNIIQVNSFRDRTCLFIGSSLTDPNLRRLLDAASRHDEKPRHFAFLLRPAIKCEDGISREAINQYKEIDENIQRRYFEAIGINIIWVDSHDEIPLILNSLITE